MKRSLCSLLATLLIGLVAIPSQGWAQLPVAPPLAGERALESECCLELLLPIGANLVALGRAVTARPTVDGAFANPAGLAGLREDYFLVHRTTLIAEASALSLLLTPGRLGTIGASYQLIDFGDTEMTDDVGMTIGALSLRHHLLVASYAPPLAGGLATGINYKFYQSRTGCSGNCGELPLATTVHAFDIGLRYAPRALPSLQLGALLSNIGFVARSGAEQPAELLPSRLRFGAAYEVLERFFPERPVAAWIALELEDSWRDPGSPKASVGIELEADEMVFLRASHVPGAGAGTGTAVGIGIHYSRFQIAVAKALGPQLAENDGEAVQLSIGIAF